MISLMEMINFGERNCNGHKEMERHPIHGIINIVKMSILLKVVYRCKTIFTKTQMTLFTEVGKATT
jgi:hypothetical protein